MPSQAPILTCCVCTASSGELSWRRENMTVHFDLKTAWERTGFPTILARETVWRAALPRAVCVLRAKAGTRPD